jgi:hypothetical protein
MKRKRINHQADIFCDMFAGWRITNDMDTLIKLKEGQFKLDILTNKITLNNNPYTDQINIVGEISDWFDRDLKDNNIPKTSILKADLTADFKVNTTDGKPKSKTKKIVTVELNMTSLIKTDEKEYSVHKDKTNEYHYIDKN